MNRALDGRRLPALSVFCLLRERERLLRGEGVRRYAERERLLGEGERLCGERERLGGERERRRVRGFSVGL